MMLKLFISMFFVTTVSQAAELTLHLIPAPKPTNWNSPQKLAKSALLNQLVKQNGGKRHSIGHAYVELSCDNFKTITGSTSLNDTEERKAIFLQGYGLGIVLKNFEGKLDDPKETIADIQSMQTTGRSNFLRFMISESTCSRLTEYLAEYQRRGYDKIYAGLNARPLYGESAGCTAFGMSFLELAGLQIPEFESSFMHDVIMPRKFVGGPLTKSKVPFIHLITAFKSKWDRDLSRNGFPLHFWDPEKMVEWTLQTADDLLSGKERVFPWSSQVVYSDQSVGIEFDARNVPTPTGPFFKVQYNK